MDSFRQAHSLLTTDILHSFIILRLEITFIFIIFVQIKGMISKYDYGCCEWIFQERKLINRAMSWKILLSGIEVGGGESESNAHNAEGGHITEHDCIGTIILAL